MFILSSWRLSFWSFSCCFYSLFFFCTKYNLEVETLNKVYWYLLEIWFWYIFWLLSFSWTSLSYSDVFLFFLVCCFLRKLCWCLCNRTHGVTWGWILDVLIFGFLSSLFKLIMTTYCWKSFPSEKLKSLWIFSSPGTPNHCHLSVQKYSYLSFFFSWQPIWEHCYCYPQYIPGQTCASSLLFSMVYNSNILSSKIHYVHSASGSRQLITSWLNFIVPTIDLAI